jgi:hypothetical protein
MSGDRDGRVDAERHRREDRRTDDRAVDEIVEGIADEDERHRRGVHLAFVGVTVPKQDELFENEEYQDAGEQRAEYRRGFQLVKRLREKGEQRHAKQGADCITDQPGHQPRSQLFVEQEERRGDEKTAAAAQEAQPQGCREESTRHSSLLA